MAIFWGRCPCGGTFDHRMVEVRVTRTKEVMFDDVPQGACPRCGARVYKAETLARVELRMAGRQIDCRLNRTIV